MSAATQAAGAAAKATGGDIVERFGKILGEETLDKVRGGARGFVDGLLSPVATAMSSAASSDVFQRIGAGAAIGGLAGGAINAVTGLAGSIASYPTFGVISGGGLSLGGIASGAMTGAIFGASVAGGGFKKTDAGGVEMRSGLRAAANVLGDLMPSSGRMTRAALEAERGSILGQAAYSMRTKGGLNVGAMRQARHYGNQARDAKRQQEAFPKKSSDPTHSDIDQAIARSHADEWGAYENLNRARAAEIGSANRKQAQQYRETGRFSSAWNTARDSFKSLDTMGKVGMGAAGAGFAYSLYQTNSLGVNVPGNRGYR